LQDVCYLETKHFLQHVFQFIIVFTFHKALNNSTVDTIHNQTVIKSTILLTIQNRCQDSDQEGKTFSLQSRADYNTGTTAPHLNCLAVESALPGHRGEHFLEYFQEITCLYTINCSSNSWSDPIQNIQTELIFSGIKKTSLIYGIKFLKLKLLSAFQDSLVQTADEIHA
jgi:hypothetical protein